MFLILWKNLPNSEHIFGSGASSRDYSSGMRARLAFGVSLAIDFELYLVDEFTEVGDRRFRSRSIKIFRRKNLPRRPI